MIKEEFKRRLTGKVANMLVKRMEESDNEKQVNDDLDRIRRLHTDGQITLETLLKGFNAVKDNTALPQVIRDNAETDIDSFSEKFHIDITADQNNSDTLKESATGSPPPEGFKYRSTNVILPASTDIDSLPSSSWTRVQGEELTRFLGQIGPVDGIIRTVPETTACHWHPLPWYEKATLIRLTDPAWGDKKLVLYYLILDGNIFRLNGTSPPIHEVNSRAPIKLSQDNAADYLRFFCFFVRGDEGPFYIVEDIKEPFIPCFESTVAREKFSDNITPVIYKGKTEQGFFSFHATVFYSNALFRGKFIVQPSGMIELLEDDPVAGDLPGRVEAPLALKL